MFPPTIKLGTKGPVVGQLQALLNKKGANIKVDEDFGPVTNSALLDFQGEQKLDQDGIVGPETWTALGVSAGDSGQQSEPPKDLPIQSGRPRPSSAKNLTIAPPQDVVLGLDLSHYQPKADWKKVAAKTNIKFCFLKASEGLGTKDNSFASHYKGCKDNGILVSAYHFFRPDYSADAQADLFLRTAKPVAGDLPPILDFETHGKGSIESQIAAAERFLSIVTDATGHWPIFYSYVSFINELKNPQVFYKYPLWLANYGVKAPHVPPPWSTCEFWQYAEEGKVEGIDAKGVDHNMFFGTLEELNKMTLT